MEKGENHVRLYTSGTQKIWRRKRTMSGCTPVVQKRYGEGGEPCQIVHQWYTKDMEKEENHVKLYNRSTQKIWRRGRTMSDCTSVVHKRYGEGGDPCTNLLDQ